MHNNHPKTQYKLAEREKELGTGFINNTTMLYNFNTFKSIVKLPIVREALILCSLVIVHDVKG
jgi:hypothetical protein